MLDPANSLRGTSCLARHITFASRLKTLSVAYMPLLNMAKKSVKSVPSDPEGSPEPSVEPKRPGTSGTELRLATNRRTASANYQAAQRAETAYKAKKRSQGAKQHRQDAMKHYSQSGQHFKEGIKSSWRCVAALPWMVRGWNEDRQIKKEKAMREKHLEKKKKLEVKLAKQAELDTEAEGEAA
ncbi:hypothetical protein BDV96DRAFT_575893 [Lophiotrema nucula]|uniref:Uncharacterized protein n=1 Tax=Lophiotrema nucula TaxID=690887 RepID=A0A6A5Z8S7_9PLEO|nr:hypothetical protein BDV96DRAFT_575893 [Lophiotrema nucula]